MCEKIGCQSVLEFMKVCWPELLAEVFLHFGVSTFGMGLVGSDLVIGPMRFGAVLIRLAIGAASSLARITHLIKLRNRSCTTQE